jgi:hypothetical protein
MHECCNSWNEEVVSSTNKTDWHDITEILLKVALNTIILTIILILKDKQLLWNTKHQSEGTVHIPLFYSDKTTQEKHISKKYLKKNVIRSLYRKQWMRTDWCFVFHRSCLSFNIRIIVRIMVFNATFNNISVISCQSVLLVEETTSPQRDSNSQL